MSQENVEVVGAAYEAFAERGIQMLDAPVSGGPAGARSGKLAIWIGGDADVFERVVGPDAVADFLAVDVRQHDVQNDDVGAILFDQHAGVEAGLGDADLEAAVLFEHLGHEFDEFGVVVHEH